MRVLVLNSDAFGGHGGIAKYNRDFLRALCAHPACQEVVAIPRYMPNLMEPLPAKLTYVTSGLGGKLNYAVAVLKVVRNNPEFDFIVCGLINLLPIAFLLRLWVQAPLVLVVHGVDAWQPTSRLLTDYLVRKIDASLPVSESIKQRFLGWARLRDDQGFLLPNAIDLENEIDAWQPTSRLLTDYLLVRKIDAFISVSELTKQRFLGWARLRDDQGFLLPNAIDLERFSPGPKSTALINRYKLSEKTVLMTLGRLSSEERYKGVDEILELLPTLVKEVPSIVYLVVGGGTDLRRLEEKARSLDIAEYVIFTGIIPEAEKVDHYRLADAFVMPGRGEGFGIVYLEAMACGVPVVASKVDGSREAVRDGTLGILVDPSNQEDVKAGILKALNRPRGVVPQGLSYFSHNNFERRQHNLIEVLSGRGRQQKTRSEESVFEDFSE